VWLRERVEERKGGRKEGKWGRGKERKGEREKGRKRKYTTVR